MNPFQKHGIEHLSASSLNLARDNLPLWIIRYLGKVKGQQSVNMLAGIAVEEAVARGLDHPDMDEEAIIQFAKDEYLKKTALGFDQEDRENKLEEITGRPAEGRKQAWDGMVRNALRTLRPYGIPTKPETVKQHRIEVFLDGIPVPLIGFKDFSFDQHGLDIDLKTTARMPTDMSFDHQLQGAVYWKALRRMLIDEHGNDKGTLKRGEHKSLQTDRVILVPGPEEEIETVRWIYRCFVDKRMNETEIADQLNSQTKQPGNTLHLVKSFD